MAATRVRIIIVFFKAIVKKNTWWDKPQTPLQGVATKEGPTEWAGNVQGGSDSTGMSAPLKNHGDKNTCGGVFVVALSGALSAGGCGKQASREETGVRSVCSGTTTPDEPAASTPPRGAPRRAPKIGLETVQGSTAEFKVLPPSPSSVIVCCRRCC